MTPTKTGNDKSNRIAVIIIDQTRRGILSIEKFLWCTFIIVKIKLIAPKIKNIPAIWSEKIDKSIEGPLWKIFEANGG